MPQEKSTEIVPSNDQKERKDTPNEQLERPISQRILADLDQKMRDIKAHAENIPGIGTESDQKREEVIKKTANDFINGYLATLKPSERKFLFSSKPVFQVVTGSHLVKVKFAADNINVEVQTVSLPCLEAAIDQRATLQSEKKERDPKVLIAELGLKARDARDRFYQDRKSVADKIRQWPSEDGYFAKILNDFLGDVYSKLTPTEKASILNEEIFMPFEFSRGIQSEAFHQRARIAFSSNNYLLTIERDPAYQS